MIIKTSLRIKNILPSAIRWRNKKLIRENAGRDENLISFHSSMEGLFVKLVKRNSFVLISRKKLLVCKRNLLWTSENSWWRKEENFLVIQNFELHSNSVLKLFIIQNRSIYWLILRTHRFWNDSKFEKEYQVYNNFFINRVDFKMFREVSAMIQSFKWLLFHYFIH